MAEPLCDCLAARLALPLPGHKAQARFAPELSFGRHRGPPAFDSRSAAVIALLYRRKNDWLVPLTLRPEHLPDHAGQICLPGGMTDQDESSEETAIRELEEELGVSPSDVRILGILSPIYVFASNFWVTPFIGVSLVRPRFRPSPTEVAEIVEVPLPTLLDPNSYGSHYIERRGVGFAAPHIACGDHRIWGATSMMLGELIAVLKDVY